LIRHCRFISLNHRTPFYWVSHCSGMKLENNQFPLVFIP